MFHHHRRVFEFSPIQVVLYEITCLERLLGHILTPDLGCNLYIHPIIKYGGKWSVLCAAAESTWLYLYKSLIKPKILFWCHIWAGAAQSLFYSLDRVQKHSCSIVGDELFPTLQPLLHR